MCEAARKSIDDTESTDEHKHDTKTHCTLHAHS